MYTEKIYTCGMLDYSSDRYKEGQVSQIPLTSTFLYGYIRVRGICKIRVTGKLNFSINDVQHGWMGGPV